MEIQIVPIVDPTTITTESLHIVDPAITTAEIKPVIDPINVTTVFQMQSEILTVQETLKEVLAPVIDDGSYVLLEQLTAKSRGMEKISMTDELRKTRHETLAFFTNGESVIELLDFTEHSNVVRHDPIIRVVGIDAAKIAGVFVKNIIGLLCKKAVQINEKVVKELQQISTRENIDELVSNIRSETEQMLKQRLMGGEQ